MSKKFPYSAYSNDEAPNYKKLVRYEINSPTEKQIRYLKVLIERCEKIGIPLDNFRMETKTKAGVRSAIKALNTLLAKNGYYDNYGNPVITYNAKEERSR